MNKWNTYLPDWNDHGPSELLKEDGTITEGEIDIEEIWDGEDEYPQATFIDKTGKILLISNFIGWRLKKDIK